MVGFLVIIILTIGLVATVGLTVFSFQRQAELVAQIQENTSKMNGIAIALGASLRVVEPSGTVRSPIDDAVPAAGARWILPTWVVGTPRTPWGSAYGWCPYSVDLTSVPAPSGYSFNGTTVRSGLSATYSGETLSNAGHSFMVRSDAPTAVAAQGAAMGVVGMIMSPVPNSTNIPDCSDVVIDATSGAFVVRGQSGTPRVGGSVVPVIARGPFAAAGTAVGNLLLYVDPSAPASGTGNTPSTPMPLTTAMNNLVASGYHSVVLGLNGGTYNLSAYAAGLNILSTIPGLNITFAATGTGGVPIITGVGTAQVAADVTFSGINLAVGSGLKALPGSRIHYSGGQISYLRNEGGDVWMDGVAMGIGSLNSGGNGFELAAGRLAFTGTTFLADAAAGYYTIYATGGDLSLAGTLLTYSGYTSSTTFSLVSSPARMSVVGTAMLNSSTLSANADVLADCPAGTTGPCSAYCPSGLYPLSASCQVSDGGADTYLKSSYKITGGWSCEWAGSADYVLTDNSSFYGTLTNSGVYSFIPFPQGSGGLQGTLNVQPDHTVTVHCGGASE